MLIENAHTHSGKTDNQPSTIWTVAKRGDFLIIMRSLLLNRLLLFQAPKSDGAVETTTYELFLITWSEAD